jgi:general secretion pathway protein M
VTICVLATVWIGVVTPLIDWYADRAERLEQRRALAGRMDVIAGGLPGLRQVAATTVKPGSGSALLDGATDAVAAAALQQVVQDLAERSGASIASAETMPATQVGAYRRIGLHVSMKAPWPDLIRLLLAVEQAEPRMLVDDLHVRGPRPGVQPVDPPLDTTMTLFCFRPGTAEK